METILERPKVMPRRLLSPTNSPAYCPVPKPRTPLNSPENNTTPPLPKPRKRKQDDIEGNYGNECLTPPATPRDPNLQSWIIVNSDYPGHAKKDQVCLDLGNEQYMDHTKSFPIYHDINYSSSRSSKLKSSKRMKYEDPFIIRNFNCTLL